MWYKIDKHFIFWFWLLITDTIFKKRRKKNGTSKFFCSVLKLFRIILFFLDIRNLLFCSILIKIWKYTNIFSMRFYGFYALFCDNKVFLVFQNINYNGCENITGIRIFRNFFAPCHLEWYKDPQKPNLIKFCWEL